MMRFLLAVATAAALLGSQAIAQQATCQRCEQRLELDAARWQCLMERLSAFSASNTSVVPFTLTEESCRSSIGARRGTAVNMPHQAAGGQTPLKVYLLTQAQLSCLREHAAAARRENALYIFDFAEQCR